VKVVAVATLTVRGFDDELHTRLRVRAARHGRSMEAEVRAVLADYLSSPRTSGSLGSRIHARFAALEGAELELPSRDDMPHAAARGSAGPIEVFDAAAAGRYADIVTARERQGQPIGMADATIAAICASRHAALATRNVKDFVDTGIERIDLWNYDPVD
jgi:plasmid stability protein